MARMNQSKKWKRRTLTALSVGLAATFSLGLFSACTEPQTEEEEPSKVSPTDEQTIKNGNFEFYSDKLIDYEESGKPLKRLRIIGSPDSWSFTSGSPSSEKQSGVINTADWAYYTRTGGNALFARLYDEENVPVFSEILPDAVAQWENDDVSAYDRLKFLDLYDEQIDDLDSNSDEAKLFAEYNYSIDFEDVETLAEEMETLSSGNEFELHEGAKTDDEDNTSVLMIHNSKTSDDGIRGTAQYYTSSTTITLAAGTSAKVSAWVRTDDLSHYKDVELTARGGAYIGVTNTVGGSTLDQMQIYNIHTNGKWQQYTVYVRASTFATTTFRIVLGLGQGSSDDKYYAVDGYAFFDDVECEILSNEEFETAVLREDNAAKDGIGFCTVDSKGDDKRFDYDEFSAKNMNTFALDLYAGFEADGDLLKEPGFGLTGQKDGQNTYTSADKGVGASEKDFTGQTTLAELAATGNETLKSVYEKDIKDKFPFEDDTPILMLLSEGGAAYTAKLGVAESANNSLFRLDPDSRILISFFVKTSAIQSGLTGAGAKIVDSNNPNNTPAISPFDSTKISTVDIDPDDESKSDLYKGWVQCFFFVENDTDAPQEFHLELTYGPTSSSIVGSNEYSYGDGYAAFTNFEIKPLTKTEYGYASTGDRAVKVSLTGRVEETKTFDSVSATEEKDLEKGPALPANYRGVLGGSDYVQKNEVSVPNVRPENIASGLLNEKYKKTYSESAEAWQAVLSKAAGSYQNADEWWRNLFGDERQPLVIVNAEGGDPTSYGYFGETASVAASSYRRISMRVKVSNGATAHIYLTDVSAAEKSGQLIYPDLPAYTYWYDDDGNIVNMDPSADNFDDEGKILYTLQSNGLYRKADSESETYYANLSNFGTDGEGNLVTKDGTIAFYAYEGAFYAYYDEETDKYSTPVNDLHTDATLPLRYDFSDLSKLKGTEIVVTGTEEEEWVTVNFYIRTGTEAKDYRIEVWGGTRDGSQKNPAGSYVFFSNFISEDVSSNYTNYLNETVEHAKAEYNAAHGYELGDDGFLGKDDLLPEEYAKYYTYTFYDSVTYLRYDETTDEDGLGNPWTNYVQSAYSESLVSLYYEDRTDGGMPKYSFYLDYSPIDVTIVADYPNDEEEPDDDHTDEDDTTDDGNIWLLISSGSLAIILLIVIVILIVRGLMKKFGKHTTKVKTKKVKRVKPKNTSPQDGNKDE